MTVRVMPPEEWLPCPDFEHLEISNYGNLRRQDGTPQKTRLFNGYVQLCSRGRTKQVNRLVARAFLGEPSDPKLQAAHNDGCRSNNFVGNLRWATAAENAADRYLHGTVAMGEDSPRATIDQASVDAIRDAYNAHMEDRIEAGFCRARRGFRKGLAKRFGVPEHVVKDILYERCWAGAKPRQQKIAKLNQSSVQNRKAA